MHLCQCMYACMYLYVCVCNYLCCPHAVMHDECYTHTSWAERHVLKKHIQSAQAFFSRASHAEHHHQKIEEINISELGFPHHFCPGHEGMSCWWNVGSLTQKQMSKFHDYFVLITQHTNVFGNPPSYFFYVACSCKQKWRFCSTNFPNGAGALTTQPLGPGQWKSQLTDSRGPSWAVLCWSGQKDADMLTQLVPCFAI